jgi:hypothetical protein
MPNYGCIVETFGEDFFYTISFIKPDTYTQNFHSNRHSHHHHRQQQQQQQLHQQKL